MIGKLFGAKRSASAGDLRTEGAAAESRKYHEVWADAIEHAQTLKKICFALLFVTILLLVLLNRAQQRPPLVIRVDEIGKAEPVKNVNATHRITKPEVLNFTRLFLKHLLERNFYTWKENFVEAGAMMTPEFREQINKQINLDEEVRAIEANKLTSKLNLSDIQVVRETKEHLVVALKGWRQVTSYNDPRFLKETIFEGEIAIRKEPRSLDVPYGMLVDSYKETVFKNE